MSIDVRGVSFSYSKKTPLAAAVLDNVSLTIKKGEFVGIMGEVGSGKSTLVKHFNGLLKPDSGAVTVDGLPAADKEVKKRIGMLFQHPQNQLFCRTVYEDIAFGPANSGIMGEELDSRVFEALRLVGLGEELLKRSPFTLSGGQMRRAALAGVLVCSPRYLVLDEPTSGLDATGRREFFSNLKKIHAGGNSIVMVSHNVEDILPFADKIILMKEGRIGFTGTPHEYLASVASPVPAITQLMRGLKARGFDVRDDVFAVDDAFHEITALWQEKQEAVGNG